MCTLALPHEVEHWSRTTLRERLIKIVAKVVKHSGYVMFQLAEVAGIRRKLAVRKQMAVIRSRFCRGWLSSLTLWSSNRLLWLSNGRQMGNLG